jgi:hypothetical protein
MFRLNLQFKEKHITFCYDFESSVDTSEKGEKTSPLLRKLLLLTNLFTKHY